MLSADQFRSLMDRVLLDDFDAAQTLVEIYEPFIQVLAKKCLTNAQLQRVVDASDISQTVLEQFFTCAERKNFYASSHENLYAFLKKMTQNAVINEHRKYSAQKRGGRVMTVDKCSSLQTSGHEPSVLCEIKDLFDFVRASLSPAERDIADLRSHGYSWPEISQKTGKPKDQLRKRLHRAYERIRSHERAPHLPDSLPLPNKQSS